MMVNVVFLLDAVQCHYPARHYVMVDDKLPILPLISRSRALANSPISISRH